MIRLLSSVLLAAPPRNNSLPFFLQVDIIHKYNADEARNLKQYGELPENARINETAVDMAMGNDGDDDEDLGISFDDI